MKAAHIHVLAYELIPSTSMVSFANSDTTSVQHALKIRFPTKPPMLTIVDIVEQGRVPSLFFTSANEKPTDAIGYAS